MVRVFGEAGTSEYEATLDLQKRIFESWLGIESSGKHHVIILAGVQCHGQRTRDIDIVVLGWFDAGISYAPLFPFSHNGQLTQPKSVLIQNFCWVIELKDHSRRGIRFQGTVVQAKYGNQWKNITNQSENQKYAFLNYLKANRIGHRPFVTNLIWLQNISNAHLPQRPHNILGGNTTWDMFLGVFLQNSPPSPQQNGNWTTYPHLSFRDWEKIKDLLSQRLQPTALDRRRMEQISQQVIDAQEIHQHIGHKLLILRGRGGTGKTIRLLQFARHLYQTEAARILLLTYNKALVADLRRLMTLLGVADSTALSSIQIQTIHSFFYDVFSALGILDGEQDNFLDNYDTYKREAQTLFANDVLTTADIQTLQVEDAYTFDWDYLFIDEGQDWPQDEQEILLRLYPSHRFVIADGVTQLIRKVTPADWHLSVAKGQRIIHPLKRCLRMKAGLTRFVSHFAEHMGLPQSDWVANEEVAGGRVVVVEGDDLLAAKDLFVELLESNQRAGNHPVDMLFCVPPQLVHSHDPTAIEAHPTQTFQNWGWEVWDGTNPQTRSTYPTALNQLRIVQYDSCRGLEGWITVNFAFDLFYDYKIQQAQLASDEVAYADEVQRLRTVQWLLIPLTRAMDTLVIHMTTRPSPVRSALEAIARQQPNFVEWRKLA